MGTSWLKRDTPEIEKDSKSTNHFATPTILRDGLVNGVRIRVVHGDLAGENTDIIVNEANTHLVNAGGIAGVLSRTAGYQLT